jgi:hypothetical protein
LTVQEFPEKAKLKCCREENCGMDECVTPCETAEWELAKLKFNQKCKTLNYPGQERFGKSNKLFIHLGEEQDIYISAPAREVLDWLEVDEPKFVASLVAMLKGPFLGFQKMRDDWVMSARRIVVSKASEEDSGDDDVQPRIRIDVQDFSGIKNNGKGYSSPWRGAYPIVTPEMILECCAQSVGKEKP